MATALFADLVGYTSLTEEHDPEVVQALLGGVFERLSQEVERYGGLVEKYAGDAMLVLFGVPQAHEDDPERSVRAALEMQSAMIELAARFAAEGRPELRVRIGIETGEVVVDQQRVARERDRMVTGDSVNVAARLQSVAAAGEVVVGPGTHAATVDVVDYEKLSTMTLKGKALAVPAWRAVRVIARGAQRAPLGIEAPLVGRDEELAELEEGVRRTAIEGRPRLLTVIGAAGVGKSRLTWELEKYLDGLPGDLHWRKGRCRSYGQPSYGGLIELIKSDALVNDDDVEAMARAKVDRRLQALGLADPAIEPALGVLFGWDGAPAHSRDELFDAWRLYLEGVARVAPLILVMEDIHWADEGLLDFLEFMARWAEGPILVLCLARHELLESRPAWSRGIANSASILLEPLGHDDSESLVDALLPGPLPGSLKQRIVAVAEGSPLFAEEVVRMLIDRGLVQRSANGWELATAVEKLDIPRSIQALLAARLDSLPAGEKRLAQAASVVGRIFWDAVLGHIMTGVSPELDRLLRGLGLKELIVTREPSALAGSREFGFRHVLIRDVAYESVAKAERAEKHLAVARWAEERLAAREDEMVELLASHYHTALDYREQGWVGDDGELDDLRRRALEYAVRAGRRAAELWSAQSAVSWFRRALEQAAKLDLTPIEYARIALEYLEVAITTDRIEDSLAIGRDAAARLAAASPLAEPDAAILGRIRAHVGQLIHATGKPDEARAMLEEGLAELEAGPVSDARARLLWRLGWLTWRAFSPSDAVPLLERAVDESRAVGSADTERRAVHDLGIALVNTGRVDEGLAMMDRSFDLARQAGDQELLQRCYINIPAMLANSSWELRRADNICREGLERVRRGGQRWIIAWLAGNLADSTSQAGRFAEADALLVESHEAATAVGDENLLRILAGYSCEHLVRYGRLAEAATWLERADGASGQQTPAVAVLRALLGWRADPLAAVAEFAAKAPSLQDADELWPTLARMAVRVGATAAASHALAASAVSDSPRPAANVAWSRALLSEPTEEGIRVIVDIGERYLEVGYVLTAAAAFEDAALLAARIDLPSASGLAARGRELLRRHGAVSLFEPAVAETDTPGTAAATASRLPH